MSDHYAVLGLARVRAAWFRDLSRWSTSAALPIEFVKCVSAEEVRARLSSGRGFSALVIDASLHSLDRDLTDTTRSAGCAVVAVTDGSSRRDWAALGVDAVLTEPVTRDAVRNVLREHAHPLATFTEGLDLAPPRQVSGWRGLLVVALGGGGVGTSTIAMAVAQGLAGDARQTGLVALVDLARRADLALLHDTGDVVPGVPELVEVHRARTPSPEEVRRMAFDCVERGYQLYLGLRRPRDWVALRPRAFEAALDGILRSHRVTVADVDAELEGEADCGSVDVEERNVMARTAVRSADVVVVVGSSGLAGVHRLAHIVDDVVRFGVDGARILPVVNRGPRQPPSRAEVAKALATALSRLHGRPVAVPSPLHLPERKGVEASHRDAAPLPRSIVDPVAAAVRALLDRAPARAEPSAERVRPGSLGAWR